MSTLTRNYSPLVEPSIYASIYPYGLYNPSLLVPSLTISRNRTRNNRDVSGVALTTNRIGSTVLDDIDIGADVALIAPLGVNPIYTPYPYSYPDLNNDNDVQRRFTLYFWYKLKRHWIIKFMKKLSKYIDPSNYSDILDSIYTKRSLAESLEKFRIRMNIDWWDLKMYKHTIKKFIYYQIKKKLKRM